MPLTSFRPGFPSIPLRLVNDDFDLIFDSDSDASDAPSPKLDRLQMAWTLAQVGYRLAGSPFGASVRGLEVWIEYGRGSTAN